MSDIIQWCQASLVCATRRVGRATQPPCIDPIPVSGPFDRVGVDVIQFPKSYASNQYALVFVAFGYLTKWPEVYAIYRGSDAPCYCKTTGGTCG